MLRVPEQGIWLKLLLLGIMQCLCSCNGLPQRDVSGKLWWEVPPAVLEIVPPRFQEAVRIELYPHAYKCDRPDPFFITRDKRPTDIEDLQSLFARQNDLLQDEAILTENVTAHLGNLAYEWTAALVVASTEIEGQWPSQTEEAYQEILQRVLSFEQREKYRQLRSRGNTREDAFRWLAVTDHQRRRMKEIYLKQLSKSQKAWGISKAFTVSTHRHIAALLLKLQTFLVKAESVMNEYRAYRDSVKNADKRLRTAERELQWLIAKLESENDPKKQIQIRKEIVDKKVKAHNLNVASMRIGGQLTEYEWQMDRISEIQGKLAVELDVLRECYRIHVECSEMIASLEGQMSYECRDKYVTLSTRLKAGLDYLAKSEQYLPVDVVRRINQIRGEIRW